MVDKDMVQTKLESLMRCVRRVELKRPASIEILENDLDLQDIIVVNIERAVQISVDLALHWMSASGLPVPETMSQAFIMASSKGLIPSGLAQRLARSVGFRNIAVHAYEKINWSIVYAIATEHMNDFREFTGYFGSALDEVEP
jgi:uncharacterized protein YutE (UPF0331/DUF86 family)